MEYESDLYAERLRRKAQAAALAAGEKQWTDELDQGARVKLGAAWTDAVRDVPDMWLEQYQIGIQRRTLRSIARSMTPSAMNTSGYDNDQRLSLIEAQHEVLGEVAEIVLSSGMGFGSTVRWREKQCSGYQSCQCDLVHLLFSFLRIRTV